MQEKKVITASIISSVVTIVFLLSIVIPGCSYAKMKPLGRDVIISWSPAPAPWFEICWNKCRCSFLQKPWFDIDICPYDDEIIPVEADMRERLVLWPPVSPFFIDNLDRSYGWCDWDGLACRGDRLSGPKTEYGCVAVDLHAEEIWADGDTDVILPIQDGGVYRDSHGNPFIKIYFPELASGTLKSWEAEIMLGQTPSVRPYETCPCDDIHCTGTVGKPSEKLSPSKSLGVVAISNMRLDIHAGGWVQMWVRKDDIDLSWFKKWRHN